MSERIATAAWIDPEEVAKSFPYSSGEFWLGRTIDAEARSIGFGDDRHILVVGGTRGGKGTTFLINNLCHWPGSAIVIDPKGENATVTAVRRGQGDPEFCEGLGQKVHVLDPYNVAKVPESYRSCFNPLDWLDGEDPLCTKKAERLATSLVPFQSKSEEYWDNEARGLIGALLVHVATCFLYEGRRSLLTLRELIMRGHVLSDEEIEMLDGEEPGDSLMFLWETMLDNPACSGYVRDSGAYFSDVFRNATEQWSGIRGGVKTATDFLTSEGMRNLLHKSDFKISDIKNDPNGQTVYLSIPQDFINSDGGWLRIMIDMVATEAKLISGQPKSGHPILFMLDEFAGLKRMDVLEKSIAQIAGYGVKMVCVVQELGQLEDVYGKNWETFVNGSGVRIFFANGDEKTKEYVSKMAGDAEIVRELQSHNESSGESYSEQSGTAVQHGTSANRGSGWGGGINGGINRGAGYKPDAGLLNLFPTKTGRNKGWQLGGSVNYNRNKGTGTSESETKSTGETKGWQVTKGEAVNESLHKRRLIEPHDVELKLARIGSKDDPRYPGIALVMVAGYPPMPIRKCNYYEDPAFHRCFMPHPDHLFSPLLPEELETPFKYLGAVRPPEQVVAVCRPHRSIISWVLSSDTVANTPVVQPGEVVERLTPLIAVGDSLSVPSPFGGRVYEVFDDNQSEECYPLLTLELTDTQWKQFDDKEDEILRVWVTLMNRSKRKCIWKLLAFLAIPVVISAVICMAFSTGYFAVAFGAILALIVLLKSMWEERKDLFFELRNLPKAFKNVEPSNFPPMVVRSLPAGDSPSHVQKLDRENAEKRRRWFQFAIDDGQWKLVKGNATTSPVLPNQREQRLE